MRQFIAISIVVFLIIILVLVTLLFVPKKYLSPGGKMRITTNGDKEMTVDQGSSVLSTLNENGVFLPSVYDSEGSCGQYELQVAEGGGEVLDPRHPRFSHKDVKGHWRLGCQCRAKSDMSLRAPGSVMGVKGWECTIIFNENVSSLIKGFRITLPPDEHTNFAPGSCTQISTPAHDCIDYDKDFNKNDIGEEYFGPWKQFNFLSLKGENPEPVAHTYSIADYPAEGDIITLTVHIVIPPFPPCPQTGLQNIPTGAGSTYIFSLREGDKVMMSGPYGDFHSDLTSGKGMIRTGGGAGMAPLRTQIMYMTKTLHTHNREMHFLYGTCSLDETFFLEDLWKLEKECPNFHFHLSLDRPDPRTDKAGMKCYTGSAVNCIRDEYFQQHEALGDCEYYLCGPPTLIETVTDHLSGIDVDRDAAICDNFG